MRIQVASIEGPITGTSAKGKTYKKINVKYYSNGKVFDKTLTQYSDAYKVLAAAMPDQLFTVDLEKNGQFTEWKNVAPVDGEVATTTSEPVVTETEEAKVGRPKGSTNKPKSATAIVDNRETAAERAKRQELIVRQSSITSAIAFYQAANADVLDADDVLKLAKKFRDFVFEDQADTQGGVELTPADTVE